jgi:hypothetical protein
VPRLSRIIEAGFYHVINRGVERRVIFYEEDDFDTFLNILNLTCSKHNIILHAFCLWSPMARLEKVFDPIQERKSPVIPSFIRP